MRRIGATRRFRGFFAGRIGRRCALICRGSDRHREAFSVTERIYAIDSDEECERLEAQARLAPVSSPLKYLPLRPGMSVLDAGGGWGSRTRQIAAAEPGATVVGVDLREPYLDFGRRKAESENLTNVTFEKADVRALPFPDASFDIVWHKYLLQWLVE